MEMAREAGFRIGPSRDGPDDVRGVGANLRWLEEIVREDERNRTWTQQHWTDYERSIAAAEREACAKLADDYFGFNAIADAIRARGDK